MANNPQTAVQRRDLLQRLFPAGAPSLWCPSLTHYNQDGGIDRARIAAHLLHLAPHVKGFLIPGSTSDGWELHDDEFWELLELALEQAQKLELHLLVGVLKTEAGAALETVAKVLAHIKARTNERDAEKALLKARVCGFAICAPHGKAVSQEDMERGLTPILELGLPIALYQLPQMTQNEIGPELVGSLAERFPNFILFKDSSGSDRVVMSGRNLGGVFTMRGAEGDYMRWLTHAGGPYPGFLLSTANCFAAELDQMINLAKAGNLDAACKLSDRITGVINDAFVIAQPVSAGNIYTNANKAIDHFLAHGPNSAEVMTPRLHARVPLPSEVIRKTGEVLVRYGLMPREGYLGR